MNEWMKHTLSLEVSSWIDSKTFELSSPSSSSFTKQVTKDFNIYVQHYLYTYIQNKLNLNSLFVIPKVKGLIILYSRQSPFQNVLIRIPKVENNHFPYIFKSCNIFHVTSIKLSLHLPLKLILPYLHKLFHFLGEINFLSPFWFFNFLHI